MKSRLFLYLGSCIAVAAWFPAISAAQTSDRLRASVTIASDYVHSGLLQTDDDPSLMLSVDYELENGFFSGATLGNVDYVSDERLSSSRDSQITVYAGYQWRRDQWRTSVTLSRYIYPDFERDYDYWYGSATVSYRDRYFASAAYSNNYLDLYDRTKQIRTGFALPWVGDIEFSATVGRFSFSGRRAETFSFWNIGISRPFGRVAADLRYHDNTLDRNSIAGNLTHDQWVVSMTLPLLLR